MAAEHLEQSLREFCNVGESERHGNSGMVTILDLPNEVLDHIFSFLSIRERIRTELVCRTWAEFGKNYKWSWPKKLTNNMVRDCGDGRRWSSVLARCGSSLKEIQIYITPPFFRVMLQTCHVIGAKCPNLTNITAFIFEADKDSKALSKVTRGCTKLKKIIIRMDSYGNSKSADTVNVCNALKECRSLEYLELVCCSSDIEENCLDAIMVPLKGFKLQSNVQTNFSLVAEKLLRRKDPLEQLELRALSDEFLDCPVEVIQQHKNTLRELNVPQRGKSFNYWCNILKPLKHLEVLSLYSSSLIEDKLMCVLADSCKKLRTLDISRVDVTDVGVSYLTALPNLTVLYMNGVEAINGEGIMSLAACGCLEELYFTNIRYSGNLIEQACIKLAMNCPNFQLLDVRHNLNITNKLVGEFLSSIQRGWLKKTVTLYLMGTNVNKDIEVCQNLKLNFCSLPFHLRL